MATIKISEDSDKLYNAMLLAAEKSADGFRKVFFQADLQTLADDAAKTVAELMILIQELVNHSLLRTLRLERAICWSCRPRKAAEAIRVLSPTEKVIYTAIEEAHTKGTWIKDLKKKTNLQKECDVALRKLESQNLVKSIRNVKAPLQKTYMLYHLVPSDDVTGGSFFDAGDLDESLIEELSNLIVFHVKQESWVDAKIRKPRRAASPVDVDAGADGRPAKRRRHTADIEDIAPPSKTKHRSARPDPETDIEVVQIPYQAYTRAYPTTEHIMNFIKTSAALRQSKADQITLAEVQSVIDILVWDDKLEKIGDGYRTVRGVSFRVPGMVQADDEEDEVGNGLTQAPCGRCPVFDLCTSDGPVNPESCVYWAEWLGK
jgi:DNA-directed RNA polymerase III subunit RPC6